MEKRQVDLIIRNGHVFTVDNTRRVFSPGAIAVSGTDVVEVGPERTVLEGYEGSRDIDAGGAPVHPGLIESHVHASLHLVRGAVPDDLPEDDVLETLYYPYWNALNDEEEYLAVAHAAIEMVRNGTTCFMEAGTVLEPDLAAQAAEMVGIRAVIGDPFIWDRPSNYVQGKNSPEATEEVGHVRVARGPQNLDQALEQLGRQLFRNLDPNALVTGHIALRGMGSASDPLLMEAKALADQAKVVVNMHQSYSAADVSAQRASLGTDPLVHLGAIGFLDTNVTLVHGNHLTDREAQTLKTSGASLVWAPAASMLWGHGASFHGRHAELWRDGVNIALGSDSSNWSNDFDMFKQLYLAVVTAREAHQAKTFLSAEDAVEMATVGGAQAVGLGARIGSIEAGKRADIVVHSLDRPEILPTTDLLKSVVYSSRSKSVSTVIINGKIVLDGGSFPNLDEASLLAQVNQAAGSVLSRIGFQTKPRWPVLS